MNRDVILLVAGGLISLISSLFTSVFAYRLTRRLWIEQEERKNKEKRREELTGTQKELQALIDIQREVLGALRGESAAKEERGLLPTAISRLEVNTERVIEGLNDEGEDIQIGELLQLALDTLNANTE